MICGSSQLYLVESHINGSFGQKRCRPLHSGIANQNSLAKNLCCSSKLRLIAVQLFPWLCTNVVYSLDIFLIKHNKSCELGRVSSITAEVVISHCLLTLRLPENASPPPVIC